MDVNEIRPSLHIPREELLDQLHREINNGISLEKTSSVRPPKDRIDNGAEVTSDSDSCSRSSHFRRQIAVHSPEEAKTVVDDDDDEEEPEFQITYL